MKTEEETRDRICLECGNELRVVDRSVNKMTYRCSVCGTEHTSEFRGAD